MKTLLWMLAAIFSWGSVRDICEPNEFDIIKAAAERNNCYGDNFRVLLAIRKAENGRPGLEFGIMHPDANDLDSQAGWAAATIVKTRKRWKDAGMPKSFIDFLADRYVPVLVDPEGHKNWKKNVWSYYQLDVSK